MADYSKAERGARGKAMQQVDQKNYPPSTLFADGGLREMVRASTMLAS
jgi:hypothetical protein